MVLQITQTLDTIPEKCKRDVGYIVDAWINDLSKGGNIETRRMASSYSAGAVNAVNKTDNSNNTVNPNSTDKCPTEFARDLVKNYILTNTAYPNKTRIDSKLIT